MKATKLYQAKEFATEEGYEVIFNEWIVKKETPCYYFCSSFLHQKSKLKKIHKTNSRFAFTNKEKAYENFMYRKRKQLQHLKRNLKLISCLVDSLNNKDFSGLHLKNGYGSQYISVKGTKEAVNSCLSFD